MTNGLFVENMAKKNSDSGKKCLKWSRNFPNENDAAQNSCFYQELFWFRCLQSISPQSKIISNFHQNGKMAAFCMGTPLCDGDVTLRAAGSVSAVRQLRPAGCVVGVPSVMWELCLWATALPGGLGRGEVWGFYSLQLCCLAAVSIPYAFDLIKILLDSEHEILPAKTLRLVSLPALLNFYVCK